MDNDAIIDTGEAWDGVLDGSHKTPAASKPAHSKSVAYLDESTPLLAQREPVPVDDPVLDYEGDDNDNDASHGNNQGPEWPGMVDFEGSPWYKTPSIYWMVVPFLLFTLSYGGTIVPRVTLIKQLICREYMTSRNLPFADPVGGDEQCNLPQVDARVALFTMARDLMGGVLAAIVSPKLGALSDRYGRLKLIVVTTMGMLVGDIAFLVVATNYHTVSYYWLMVGYALDGLSGSFIAAMAISHAYATDCTPPDKRNIAFGYYHSCLFAGIAVGPMAAGLLVKRTGNILSVFWFALAAHIFFVVSMLCIVPESLSKRRQRIARERHAKIDAELRKRLTPTRYWLNVWVLNIFEPLRILWPTGEGSSPRLRRNLVLLAGMDATAFGIAMGAMTVVIVYIGSQFKWDTYDSSIYVSIVNGSRVFVLVAILPTVTRLVRGKTSTRNPQPQRGGDALDLAIIRFAMVLDTIAYIGFTLVRTGALFTLFAVIGAIAGIGPPTLQSTLTKHVPPDRTGQILGATGTLHALARIVAPTAFNGIFALTVGTFPQAVFLCLGACFACVAVASFFVRPGVYYDDPGDPVPGVSDGEVDGEVGRS